MGGLPIKEDAIVVPDSCTGSGGPEKAPCVAFRPVPGCLVPVGRRARGAA